MSEKVKVIPIAETGILTEIEPEERTPLKAGMTIIIEKIALRTSRKYGTYAVFDGENLDGEKMHYFTMSSVLTSQAAALLEKYGSDDEGNLSSPILASVISKKSEGGRYYLTFS